MDVLKFRDGFSEFESRLKNPPPKTRSPAQLRQKERSSTTETVVEPHRVQGRVWRGGLILLYGLPEMRLAITD
jgi:hypothetical protein